MSLAFPPNPTVNQVYQKWIWGGSSWDAYEALRARTWESRSGDVGMRASDLDLRGGSLVPGQRVLLKSDKISGSATQLIFKPIGGFVDYDIYECEWIDLKGGLDCSMFFGISYDGTSYPLDGFAYATLYHGSDNNTFSGGGVTQPANNWGLGLGPLYVNRFASGSARIYLPNTTDRPKHILWKNGSYSPSIIYTVEGFGTYWAATVWLAPVLAMRLTFSQYATGGIVNWYGIGNGPERG